MSSLYNSIVDNESSLWTTSTTSSVPESLLWSRYFEICLKGNYVEDAAKRADKCLEEFKKRYGNDDKCQGVGNE